MAIAGDFDDLTFDCDSTRWLGLYGSAIEEVLGSFGVDAKAVVTGTFGGATRTGIQIEGPRTNDQNYSESMDNWSASNMTVDDDTTDTTDPVGNNDAEGLEPNTSETEHHVREYCYLDGDSEEGTYAVSLYLKTEQSTAYNAQIKTVHTGDTSTIDCDLTNGVVDASSGVYYSDIWDADDDWWYCWYTRDINECALWEWVEYKIIALDDDNPYFVGDGSSIYAWQAQVEYGYWPTSIIPVAGTTPVTRDATDAYWDENDVDSNLRGEIDIYVIPRFSSDALNDSGLEATVIHFDDATQDYRLYFEPGASSDGRLILEGASAIITTSDLSWSAGQLLKITLDPNDGSNSKITCALFTSGNGSYTGTTYSTDDGDVWLGRRAAGGDYFYGIIFEPEYEEAESDEHSAAMLGYNF